MDNDKILATEVAENVEQTTEESGGVEQIETPAPKTYTQEEVDEIVGKRIARNTAKIRKEYDRKYGELESVLKAGTGKEDVVEMTDTFKKFYESKGIKMPTKPSYSDRDMAVLAKAEAEDIIRGGFDDVVEEVDRLADIGVENMSAREKAVFKELAEYRKAEEEGRELAKLGASKEMYGSAEFKEFASNFKSGTPITKIYEIYNKTQPKKEITTMGSMRNSTPTTDTVKDFYTREEAMRFSKKDFDKNPALFKAVEKSMLKW